MKFAGVAEAKTTAVVGLRLLLLIFCSPTQASKVNEGGRGGGDCQMVVTPRSSTFIDWDFFLFMRTTTTLRYKVPRNGGVACVLNDWNPGLALRHRTAPRERGRTFFS